MTIDIKPMDFTELACHECRHGDCLGFDFTMAMQPIIDTDTQQVFAYEALVRGLNNESAYSILSQVNERNRYRFDQSCRVKAIAIAAKLAIPCYVSINFLPNAVYKPELCIRTTLAAAKQYDFPVERILFELIEDERVNDASHLMRIIEAYKSMGFKTALDDFGSGYSGFNLLASFQPDIIKLDMELVRDVDTQPVKQAIVSSMQHLCTKIGVRLLAEGVETRTEFAFLKSIGINLFQGYYIAKPGFESLPSINPEVFTQ